MKIIKKIYNKIARISFRIYAIIKIAMCSVFYRNKIYIFGTPVHGNLGDQAILLGEEKFLKDNFQHMKIIEVESNVVIKLNKLLKVLVGKSLILVSGGGFLGTLWLNEEEMFRTTLKTFKNNTIIVLPQTIYFTDDAKGKQVLKESKEIYQSHKKLCICCREAYSFNFMKQEFPSCNILLIPDMVLYLDTLKDECQRKNVLFCIRKDKEKISYNLDLLGDLLRDKRNFQIDYTDTVIKKNIYTVKGRKKQVERKIKQFRSYQMVVTDRLHGMVFALLAGTPCLVFQNKSYKVKGLYQWIKNANYIKLADNDNMLELAIELLNTKHKTYEESDLSRYYQLLAETIDMQLKNQTLKEEGKTKR